IGFERTILEIVYPFLDKLSVLWLTGSVNPVQENFMSYLIRQKIISAIDNEPFSSGKNVKKFIIYLPEGENQELSLLLTHYLLKSRRNQVIYLGQNVSIQDLKDACTIHRPDYIFTMITETYSRQPVQKYVDNLAEQFPECEVLLSGYQIMAQNVSSKGNITALGSLDDVINFLDILRNRASLKNIIH
ncbi:MAG: helix-turn-helix-type transcriptional regulator, partial [Bacteroidota bacterium]